MSRGPGGPFPKSDSGHTGTISSMIRVGRTSWNAMKPRIQRVLTQSNPGFTASGSGPIVMINVS